MEAPKEIYLQVKDKINYLLAHFSCKPRGEEFGYRNVKYIRADLVELTAEDVRLITKIHYQLFFNDISGIKVGDVAEEVLRRFNEYKAGKK